MSIRYGLLALLERGPSHGAQLRSDFETRTGTTWPLNVGQVYTTLARLERDGLVASEPGADGRQQYAISGAGRLEVSGWYARPVDRSQPARDELAIKIAMAAGAPGGDARAVISAQRRHTLRVLQGYARLTARALASGAAERKGLAWLLVLEQLVFQAEAEVRWLAHCDRVLGDLPEPAAPPPLGEPPDGADGAGGPAAERRPSRSGAARAGGGAGPVTRPRHRRTVPTRPRTTAPPRRLTAARPPNTAPPRRPDAASQPRRTVREGTTA